MRDMTSMNGNQPDAVGVLEDHTYWAVIEN
jgi:hypothetical protein